MGLNLQQTALLADDSQNTDPVARAALEDTQGNILKSNGRDNNVHLFLTFTGDADAVQAWLRTMGTQHVTSAWAQHLQARERRRTGTDGGVFVNLGLSAAGYAAAGLTAVMPDDKAFAHGAKKRVALLNDPPVDQWEPGFQAELHALVMVAADDAADTQAAADAIVATLEGVATVADTEVGAAMRVDRDGKVTDDGSGTVHEHFGFADGVSQPLFMQSDLERARRRSGGFDRYDPSAPLALVLLKDPGGGPDGYGSYFVYRKLQQDVAGFHGDETALAQALAKAQGKTEPSESDQRLASAYVVGRFRDGTPVVEQAEDGWLTEPNNFSFDADVDGTRCPFQAHIRKMNPRGDKARQFALPMGEDRARRIVRRAVSFGPLTLDPPPDQPVGLLFVCGQSSIVDQFEFLQSEWANFTGFLRPGTGLDPLIGEPGPGDPAIPQPWPFDYGSFNSLNANNGPYVPFQFGQWVTLKGAEYFFLPSLSMLAGAGA